MKRALLGLLGFFIVIFAISFAFSNFIAFAAIALIVWGIYELNINRKLGARLKVPGIIISLGLILFCGAIAFSDPPSQDQPTASTEINQVTSSKDEGTNNSTDRDETVLPIKSETESKPSADESSEEENAEPEYVTAIVTRIVDGDTIDVEIDGKEERLRLLLVDTPETKDPNEPIQPFGPEATAFAEKILNGKEVKLEFDGPERDKYDRLLVYLWLGDKIFNQMLLEEGLARVAYVYDPTYTHYDSFVAAEKKAKVAKKGIWSIPGYVTEDGFNEKVVAIKKTTTSNKQSTTSNKQEKQTTKQATTKEQKNTQQKEVYYARCADARAAGAAPIMRGEPGYRPALDRDNDGIACE